MLAQVHSSDEAAGGCRDVAPSLPGDLPSRGCVPRVGPGGREGPLWGHLRSSSLFLVSPEAALRPSEDPSLSGSQPWFPPRPAQAPG